MKIFFLFHKIETIDFISVVIFFLVIIIIIDTLRVLNAKEAVTT